VKIDDDSSKPGDVEMVARLEGDVSTTHAYDDFTFDYSRNAYLALHSYAVVKITPDGTQTTFARGGNSTVFKEPTSAALLGDGKSIYISTGGTTIDSTVYGGQVIKVAI